MRFLLICSLLGLLACSDVPATAAVAEGAVPTQTEAEGALPPTTTTTPQTAKAETLLCQINGEPWAYTKASGIVSRNRQSGKRTAIITFKRKLEKGSESVQLYYNGDSYELEGVSLQLKQAKTDGGLFTAFYVIQPDTRDRYPNTTLSGTLDLSDLEVAAGTAAVTKLDIRWEKDKLEHADDAVISVTDLQFSGIGYSDLVKVKKELGG